MRPFALLFLIPLTFSLAAQEAAPDPLNVDETTLTFDAPPPAAEEDDVPIPQDVGLWDVARMLLVLALVVGLIWALVWLMRRLNKRHEEKLDGVRLLATYSLSATRVVYFLEMGARVLVLSGAENGVQLLTELQDQELIDGLRLAAGRTAARRDPFKELVGRFLKKNETPGNTPTNVTESSDFLRRQRERLRNLEKDG